jgi:dihydrofolate reductase
MGRNTYLAIQSYPDSLRDIFEQLPIKKVVVSRDKNFAPKVGYFISSSPSESVTNNGDKILLCSGGHLNSSFLNEKITDRIIVYVLPVIVGGGTSLFADMPINQTDVILESSDVSKSFAKLVYRIQKN